LTDYADLDGERGQLVRYIAYLHGLTDGYRQALEGTSTINLEARLRTREYEIQKIETELRETLEKPLEGKGDE